ncbi:MAG: type II/IV secretion system protein, partial [Gemmatimonadetes bacterium]|nr:type II/IV secretion system protein [Gemmatimonadota bacterium]
MDQDRIAQLVAARYRTKVADLTTIEPGVLRLLPASVARQHLILPVRADYHQLVVAVANPTDLEAEQAAAFASGRKVRLEVASPARLLERMDQLYDQPNQKVGRLLDAAMQEETGIQVVEQDIDTGPSKTEVDSEPVIRLTNLILVKAIEQGASDIHLQPERESGVVRFRVDGVLRRHLEMPMPALVRVISRIKVMGKMDIADRLRPQDGRARVRVGGGNYDLRISTVPARDHEKAVIRILDQGRSIEGLGETGMHPLEVQRFRQTLKGRDGIVVVTGPTGSGKTTTLYSALRELSTEEVNIMTVEDPIEYELPGITQIQVDSRRKVTFASTLRAILRQDPDIILVGEIRDLETAEVAVQAAMTGHLVLATLHTNDAVSAVQRLLDIGLDRAAVAGSLRASLAQRLVRRVCTTCKGAGGRCEPCGGSGYRSRLPVVELLSVDEEITRLILSGAPLSDIERAAVEHGGMRTMHTVATTLVERGVTTASEVERVLGEVV